VSETTIVALISVIASSIVALTGTIVPQVLGARERAQERNVTVAGSRKLVARQEIGSLFRDPFLLHTSLA
jgi:hypothetical protein